MTLACVGLPAETRVWASWLGRRAEGRSPREGAILEAFVFCSGGGLVSTGGGWVHVCEGGGLSGCMDVV
jgi:hypothetical protein